MGQILSCPQRIGWCPRAAPCSLPSPLWDLSKPRSFLGCDPPIPVQSRVWGGAGPKITFFFCFVSFFGGWVPWVPPMPSALQQPKIEATPKVPLAPQVLCRPHGGTVPPPRPHLPPSNSLCFSGAAPSQPEQPPRYCIAEQHLILGPPHPTHMGLAPPMLPKPSPTCGPGGAAGPPSPLPPYPRRDKHHPSYGDPLSFSFFFFLVFCVFKSKIKCVRK